MSSSARYDTLMFLKYFSYPARSAIHCGHMLRMAEVVVVVVVGAAVVVVVDVAGALVGASVGALVDALAGASDVGGSVDILVGASVVGGSVAFSVVDATTTTSSFRVERAERRA